MTGPIDTSSRPVALIGAYAALIASLREGLSNVLGALWTALPGYRDHDAAAFASKAVPLVAGAMKQAANLTMAYLATLLSHQTGQPVRPISILAGDLAKLRGIDPREEYRRPFATVYRALAEGQPLIDAAERGRIRLVDLASTDVQLAKTRTAQRVLQSVPGTVVGYRRVLTGAHSCGLCVMASTQLYHTAELMPIHPACDCAVAPIIGENDPGQVINEPLLEAAHLAIAERFAQFDFGARAVDYRKVLLVHQHGELGPVLAVAGHRFTGPDELGGPDDPVAKAFREHSLTAAA